MVPVPSNKLLVSVIAVSLVVGPAAIGSVQALENSTEPDCYPAEDGTGAYICELPEDCQEDCPVPPECERVDDRTFRCVPPEEPTEAETVNETEASDEHDLIRPEQRPNESELGQAMAECALDEPNGTVVCQPVEECREDPTREACSPPSECERGDDGLVRCDPRPGRGGPPEQAEAREGGSGSYEGEANRSGSSEGGAECRPAPDGDAMLCKPPAECRDRVGETEACTPPPECEQRSDGLYRCEAPDGARPSDGSAPQQSGSVGQPDCRPGEERGTVVCEPPAECEGKIGETRACTPPPECEQRSDGSFLCQIPDRGQREAPSEPDASAEQREAAPQDGPNGTEGSNITAGDEDLFRGDNEEKRAKARAQVAQGLKEAAESFRSKLDDLRSNYQAQVDDLRADYQDRKQQLRDDYEDCRSSIPEDASPSERSDKLQACLDEARQSLADLRQKMRSEHDQLQQDVKQKAEQAREKACQKAENAALEAIGDHGLFDANPGDLMPERALELCPSFGSFEGGEQR